MVTYHPSNRRTASIRGNGILRPETFANGASARADRPISGETCAFPRSVAEESGQLSGRAIHHRCSGIVKTKRVSSGVEVATSPPPCA
jgi:hypothetical protein